MLKGNEYQKFINKLYKSLKDGMTALDKDLHYHSLLPSEIQQVKSELYNISYGHPIDWQLVGKSGVHGFIIGVLTKESRVSDDTSENNYYPPVITQELSSISPEYTYSQIAIVLVIGDINAKVEDWLKDWKDDNRYFRKILLTIPKDWSIDMISQKIISNCFTPWYSIKLIEKDLDETNAFLEEEE